MAADSKPKTPVAFSKPVARRVAQATRRVERSLYATDQRASGSGYGPWVTIQPATVTTAIPSGSLGSPSTTGQVTIYRDDDAGGLVAAETGAPCHNYHALAASVAIGKTVSVYWRAGFWWLVAADCP